MNYHIDRNEEAEERKQQSWSMCLAWVANIRCKMVDIWNAGEEHMGQSVSGLKPGGGGTYGKQQSTLCSVSGSLMAHT